jgi:Co/Zn/Cd efflux system component
LLISYEAASRLFAPVPIHFSEAIPIAILGLLVNIGSLWLPSGGDHDQAHSDDGVEHRVETSAGRLMPSIFEDGVQARFRLWAAGDNSVLQ